MQVVKLLPIQHYMASLGPISEDICEYTEACMN